VIAESVHVQAVIDAVIDVQNGKPARAGRYTDVRIRPPQPPTPHLAGVSRGRLESPGHHRLFPSGFAREDVPPTGDTAKSNVNHRHVKLTVSTMVGKTRAPNANAPPIKVNNVIRFICS
jgi:hypothetical protein